MNITLLHDMIKKYDEMSYTHNYIFGYEDHGNVYASVATSDILPYVCYLDRNSSKNGGGYSLRFRPNKSQKELLKTAQTFVLCSSAYFTEVFMNCKYNRGEVFEKLITERFGQEWYKDNVPFTQAGDIEVDGVPYQIKFNKATFCSEGQL